MTVYRRPIKLSRRAKYRAVPTVVEGVKFASKREAGCYCRLRNRQIAGHIRDLKLQVRFPLCVGGRLITTYVADFVYLDVQAGERVVADAKGFVTREYKIKKKLMAALHGIEIEEM